MGLRGKMVAASVVCLCASLLSLCFRGAVPLAVTIALGTTAYHLGMRLLVGLIFDRTMANKADVGAAWFRELSWEPRLYRALRVRRWKAHMPTWSPDSFDPSRHTWAEIAQAMCQAELVHETIAVLSFLPLAVCVACGNWGDAPVFAITSILASAVDLSFVVMQRYNRPRVLRIARRMSQKVAQGDVQGPT